MRKFNFFRLFIILIIPFTTLQAQIFNKITTGLIPNDGHSTYGSAWVDFNHDKNIDLFITNNSTENDMLYINNGNGNFSLFTGNPIVQDSIYSYSSTWADIDKDGWEDCFITHGNYYAPDQLNALFKNNTLGSFNFTVGGVASSDTGNSDGAAWADYDNDGFIDLFIANFNNGPNFLYHNTHNNTFTKVLTGNIATDVAPASGSGAWGDYDNDGLLDLFVSNFGSPNFLYHNDGSGNFTKITSGDIVTDMGDSHGASWGDYDNDGYLDLFVNRWYNQDDLLYHNNGNGTFTKITTGPVVNNAGYGTGSSWGDYDNDGDLDLIVVNSSAWTTAQINYLYENLGGGNFSLVNTAPFNSDISYSRGVSWCDYDNDGDLDLHIANEYNINDFLYENLGNNNSWINIHLTGNLSNHSAIGTRVKAKAIIGGIPVWQNNFISSQTGYSGENSLNVEFGFGTASIIDSLIIEWPSGITCQYANVAANQFLEISESCIIVTAAEELARENDDYFIKIFPNPVSNKNSNLQITFFGNNSENKRLQLFDAAGKLIFEQTNSNSNIINIPSSEFQLNAGIYFIVIQTKEKSYSKKFVVQN